MRPLAHKNTAPIQNKISNQAGRNRPRVIRPSRTYIRTAIVSRPYLFYALFTFHQNLLHFKAFICRFFNRVLTLFSSSANAFLFLRRRFLIPCWRFFFLRWRFFNRMLTLFWYLVGAFLIPCGRFINTLLTLFCRSLQLGIAYAHAWHMRANTARMNSIWRVFGTVTKAGTWTNRESTFGCWLARHRLW